MNYCDKLPYQQLSFLQEKEQRNGEANNFNLKSCPAHWVHLNLSSTRGYLVFQEQDKLVLLSNQEVTLPKEKHTPKNHIEKLKKDIQEFRKTFEFSSMTRTNTSGNQNHEIILAIKNKNSSLTKKISIKIPSNFVLLTDSSTESEKFYEFIPKGEDSYKWNELITIMQTPSNCSMSQFLEHMKNLYRGKNEKCTYNLAEENGVKTAFLIADYPARIPNSNPNASIAKIPNKNEILMIKAIKELNRFTTIQYSKRYDSKSSADAKELIKEQMLNLLKSYEIQ